MHAKMTCSNDMVVNILCSPSHYVKAMTQKWKEEEKNEIFDVIKHEFELDCFELPASHTILVRVN